MYAEVYSESRQSVVWGNHDASVGGRRGRFREPGDVDRGSSRNSEASRFWLQTLQGSRSRLAACAGGEFGGGRIPTSRRRGTNRKGRVCSRRAGKGPRWA